MASLTVTQLNIYPVKSCAGISLSTLAINEWGPEWDRRMMVTDSEGAFLTARKYPQLLQVRTAIRMQGLMLSVPGKSSLTIDLPVEKDDTVGRIDTKVWRDQVEAQRISRAADQWFSELLRCPAQLVFMPETHYRQVDPDYFSQQQRVSFADSFPFLLTHQNSLDELNQRLPTPLPMSRFRPNIVIDGDAPWAEDRWQKLRIGGLNFAVVKPCSRCIMTTFDVDTLAPSKEPLKTLGTYRRTDSGIIFGQNLVHLEYGVLRVGDEVEILA